MLSSLPVLNAGPLFFCQVIYRLHGPPMSVDKTDFGLVLYNHANLVGLRKHLVFGRLKRISVFCLLFIGQPATHLHHSVLPYSDQYRKHCAGSA